MKDLSATDFPEPMGPDTRSISSVSTPSLSMATVVVSEEELKACELSKSLSNGMRTKP
jgi:hypothetical protein